MKDTSRSPIYRSNYQLTSQQPINFENYDVRLAKLYKGRRNVSSPRRLNHLILRPRHSSSPNLSDPQLKKRESVECLLSSPVIDEKLIKNDLVKNEEHYTAAFKKLRSSTNRVSEPERSFPGIRKKISFEKEPMEWSYSRSREPSCGAQDGGQEVSFSNRSGTNLTNTSLRTLTYSDDSTDSTSTFQTQDPTLFNVRITEAHLKQEPPTSKLVRPDLEPRPTVLCKDLTNQASLDHLNIRHNRILVSLLDSNRSHRNKERVIFTDEGHTIYYHKARLLSSKERAIILTNKSLYLFPPLVWVESKSYIVANDFEVYNMSNIARISLPYRTKVNSVTYDEVAVRTNEVALHLLTGWTIWLSLKSAKREEFVESLNSVYQLRLGSPTLMTQEDYQQLLRSITKSSLWESMARLTFKAWATGAQILKSGRLFYQERKGDRDRICKRWRRKWVCLFVHALVVLDSHEDLEQLRRGNFISDKFEIFRLRGSCLRRNTKKPIEWRVVENPKNNVLVEARRCAEFQAKSSLETRTWVEAISRRRDLSLHKCVVANDDTRISYI